MLSKKNKTLCIILGILALAYGGLVFYAYLPSGPVVPVDRLAGKESRFVTVSGINLHYTQQGDGSPLVLIHGFGGSIYTWRSLMPLLAQRHTVYALDLPGFGLSDKPSRGDYSMAGQAAMVLGFLDALHIPSPTLAGHSMGGVIASYAAVRALERIHKLILIEPGFYHGGAPAILRYLIFPLQRIMAKSFYTREGRLRTLTPSFYDKNLITDELLSAFLQAGQTPNAVAALEHMMRTAGEESYEGLSSKITTPTLLVWSRNNANNPLTDGRRLQQEIHRAQLAIIEQSGHYIQEEQPQALAAAIETFTD